MKRVLILRGDAADDLDALRRGRTTPGFPPLKPDLEAAGATFEEGADVVDGNVVSCRGWADLPEWWRAFVKVLERTAVPA